jgi:hypothetical protein
VLRTIDRNDWDHFFASFTTAHDHWLVHVDGENASLPLEAILVRGPIITITLGGDISHHRRIVIDAAAISVQQSGGVDESVSIQSNDGHTTRLRFRSPMPPRPLDVTV